MSGSDSSNNQLLSVATSVPDKGSRNKRKFHADSPPGDPNKVQYPTQNNYEFSAEKFELTLNSGHLSSCDVCLTNKDRCDALKLNLGLSNAKGLSGMGPSKPRQEVQEVHDTDWSEFTESQLEVLVLRNLDATFKSAIRKIVACGFDEELAKKAVLRSGLCHGRKDTVTNIVENALVFIRSDQENHTSRVPYFEELQEMQKYVLAELVCVLRAVRPSFSTGDAMWCLLLSDMNLSHACAMDTSLLGQIVGEGDRSDNSSAANPQLRAESKASDLGQPSAAIKCNHICPEAPSAVPIPCAQSSQMETPTFVSDPNITKPVDSLVLNGLVPKKESPSSTLDTADKPFGVAGASRSPVPEEKFGSSRKVPGISKRDYVLRQKSLHPEKTYRTYGSKGSSRAAKYNGFGGLMLDKKLNSVAESAGVNMKIPSLKITKGLAVDVPEDGGNNNQPAIPGLTPMSPTLAFNLDDVNTSTAPSTAISPASSMLNAQTTLSAADTELSLSLPSKNNDAPLPISSNAEVPHSTSVGISHDKSSEQWMLRDQKDEMIEKLAPKVQELQNQLEEWTEWANQKVMQAARRLGKDKAELKLLRQEKEELERLKKEKQTLEENTLKKLSEMGNALSKASGQVERANSAVRRLEVENGALRQEMEAAKLQATESSINCHEVVKREKNTLTKFQSWEKEKALFLEELAAEKRKKGQVQQELQQATEIKDQLVARWKQEEKAKEEYLAQANSIRNERLQMEASAKSKEDMMKMKAEHSLQRYKDQIERLEKQVSQLRLKSDSSKIDALRRGIDGNVRSLPAPKEVQVSSIYSPAATGFNDDSDPGGVKRERECVMCLTEEMSVLFLPCAHQVVCVGCNDTHVKQGMKDCPSCRTVIQRRIPVRYARS